MLSICFLPFVKVWSSVNYFGGAMTCPLAWKDVVGIYQCFCLLQEEGEEHLVLIYTQERPWSLGSRKSSYLHKVLRRGYSHLGWFAPPCNYHHNCLTGKGRSSGRKIHQENESLNFFLSRWNKEFWFRLTLPIFFSFCRCSVSISIFLICRCLQGFNAHPLTICFSPTMNPDRWNSGSLWKQKCVFWLF